jgi:serine/threonine protein kinase
MEPGRWRKIDELFHAAAVCAGRERERILTLGCADDGVLRAEIESLLTAHERALSFIETPAFEASAHGAASATPTVEAGQRIGRYVLHGVIGHGGMGVVYEAEQENPRRRVALKVIRPGLVNDRSLRRFEHESQLLARLQHAGIAQIYEAGTATIGGSEQPYFAMELVRGVPITQYARSAARNGLTIRARLELMARVCDAVEHAHQKGVIHRDLKPANILVVDDSEPPTSQIRRGGPVGGDVRALESPGVPETPRPGGRGSDTPVQCASPKILDFGVARATDADVQTATLQIDVGQLLGTIPYMSPEQVTGRLIDVDTRSDVYALGVLCYELLTERLPYPIAGKSIAEAARLIREQAALPLSSVNRALRGDLDTILAKALEKDRERRYPSARALATDLRHYLAGEPIEARRDSLLYVIRKRLVRHPAGAALAGSVVLLLLVSVWATRQHGEATRAQDAAEVQARISALRATRLQPADLEVPGSSAAQAAAAVWTRVRQGVATEDELRELAEASVRLDCSEPSLLDLSRHAVLEGGFALNYATRVYACPPEWGFLLSPKFVLDGKRLADSGAVFRSKQRRLPPVIHVPSLSVGQHTLTGVLEVTVAHAESGTGALPRTEPAQEGSGERYLPLSPAFTIPLGPYRFAAVEEHPPDYPVIIKEPSYQERMAAELVIEAAQLAPEPPITRRPPGMRDELHVVLSFPPPPLELALRIEIRAPESDFQTSVLVALVPSGDAQGPELVYTSDPLKPLLDPQRCRLTLRIPAAMVLATTNPESLLNRPLIVELAASRDAARSASFERFLSVTLTRSTAVADARPAERRAAGALVYGLLDELLSPGIVEARVHELAVDENVRDQALALVHELSGPHLLRLQAWQPVADATATPWVRAKALGRAREAARLDPENPDSQQVLGAALYRSRQYDEATVALRRALELDGGDRVSLLAFLAMTEYCRGQPEEADALLEQVERESASTPVIPQQSRQQAREAADLIRPRQPCSANAG